MAELNQFEEKMDLFLRGEMSPGEADEFRQELDSDPLLKSEFEMNDAIVNGIKQYRKAEIKARLASLPISPVPVNFWVGVGGTAIIGGITATVIYNLAIDEPESVPQEFEPVTEEVTEMPDGNNDAYDISEELTEDGSTDQEIPAEGAPVLKVISEPQGKETNSVEEMVSNEIPDQESSQPSTKVVLPTGPEESENLERKSESPESTIEPSTSRVEQMDVEIKQHPEYGFHYKYSNHKLFIYGSLDKEPYRLIELDQGGTTNLYLAYDGKYYFLKDQTITPEPLKPIRDKKLLKNLRELDSSN